MNTPTTAATAAWPCGRIPNTITLDDGRRVVCRIYDAGPELADRYTVALKAQRHPRHGLFWPYLASGPAPFHPMGFGQYGEASSPVRGARLGKRVRFEDVPADVQKFILLQFAK